MIDHVILHNNFLLACCSDISFLFSQICTLTCTCISFFFSTLRLFSHPQLFCFTFHPPLAGGSRRRAIFSVCCRPLHPRWVFQVRMERGRETGHVRFPAPKITEVAAAAEVKRKGNRREAEKELLCSHAARELACLLASVRCNIREKRKSYICSPPFRGQ